jgi:hypothetical protein
MTIVELLINAIFKSYKEVKRMNTHSVDSYDQELKNDSVFQGLVNGELKGFFINIIEFNLQSIKGTFVEDKLNEAKRYQRGDVAHVIKSG